ncbi:uncharacterized protein RCC_05430 [Ramularia collo-cygni]|uniref:Tautomerase cis-CaaD-like domain-containing protein n=1 Tax=Ramularia collo-cygni TaxID=112498 RepID=A0A2D3VD42_9PEZI|nr:uncharacterized protein RCC_05430 [Ramularia collo-cygni]CZT19579.1 uncharacterized protein RCC_05430 [Ramularia collo-cygni]
MPLWQIYHPPNTFQDAASKSSLAKAITANYTKIGMPAFFVVVNYIETEEQNMFVGGELAHTRGSPFIRLVITHIHVNMPNEDSAYAGVTTRIDELLKPHIADKGYDWEYHVDETERRLWKLNGIYAPPFKSEDEKVWVKENRAVPPEEMEAARQKMEST